MSLCFVIQPFDRAAFDKRYEEILKPAISAAGLEAYRVDQDPGVVIPIEDIEKRMLDAHACVADISTDNPNVWFELGYALASGKHVVMLCSQHLRGKLPFDVQHRRVIYYKTDSPGDFKDLGSQITNTLIAMQEKSRELKTLSQMSPIQETEGLSSFEIVALVIVMQNRLTPLASVTPWQIKSDMTQAGYTEIAVSLTLESLIRKTFLRLTEESDDHGNSYQAYQITDKGVSWLLANQDKLLLRRDEGADQSAPF